jgi:hypothetical protein
VVFVVVASSAWAQLAPTVAPFPLEVLRGPSPPTETERAELVAEFSGALRKAGAIVPNKGEMIAVLGSLKRQDCDRENECLSALALKARSLYAVYAGIDYNLNKQLVISGRVVRDDGKEMASVKSLAMTLGDKAFLVAAKDLITKLVTELKVSSLPATRPSTPEPVAKVTIPDGGAIFTPPPPPPLMDSPLRTVGYVAVASGIGAIVVGGVLYGIGSGSARSVDARQYIVPMANESAQEARNAYGTAAALQPVGLTVIGIGAAGAVAGAVMLFMTSSGDPARETPKAFVSPMSGGAVVGVTGELP